MPIRRFRNISDMEDVWYEPGDPALVRALRNVWGFAELVCRPRFPPGVFKHRTIEELNAQTELWQEQNFRAFQERRSAQRRRDDGKPK